MHAKYAYVGQWNARLRRPMPGESWLDEADARDAYESRSRRFDVVSADARAEGADGRGGPAPFVLTVWAGGVSAATTQFYTEHGTLWRSIEYKEVDGRLFTWIVDDYSYPGDDKRYAASQSILHLTGTFDPDGTGTLTVNDKSKPTVDRLSMDQVDVSGNWFERPAFGDWGPLVDPGAGTIPGPAA